MFVDEVTIKVEAGSGGDGCLAFRREKYIPMGGPFGGNGGHGSNIRFVVDEGLHTLIDLRYMKVIKGKKGENGRGKNQNGANAEEVIIRVPQGTVITDLDTGFVLADLKDKNSSCVVAEGGRGGRGNTAFKTQSNPAPNYAENGEPGEQRRLKVELKLLADVGLVGLPSVGKSTFISKVSASRPKIAEYHFTTLSPNLGVAKTKDGRSFVIADLPGLIEGASNGLGLGDKFLKHVERTKVIAHIIDMSGFEGRDPYEDYLTINKELESFSKKLIEKPQIVVANKMDMPSSKENLEKFKSKVDKEVFEISALTSTGLDDILMKLADMLEQIPNEDLYKEENFESHILYKFKKEEPYIITREGNEWIIKGDEIEKMFRMTKFTDEGLSRFSKKIRKMGIDDKLEELGAVDGDIVRILDFTFEYKN
ncbi:MAG: GTPase ObgE [bacterium]|nr:GTPase ObgE [bacterium]